jgi:hypothetical protein
MLVDTKQFKRIIFENGIELAKEANGEWVVQSTRDERIVRTPEQITDLYAVTAVAVEFDRKNMPATTPLFVGRNSKPPFYVVQPMYIQEVIDKGAYSLMNLLHLTYIMNAAIYHCVQMACNYSSITSTYVKWPFPVDHVQSEKVNLSNQYEAYFEFDAFLSALRRVFNAYRFAIWELFEKGKGQPHKSFESLLKKSGKLPQDLHGLLKHSWSEYGDKIKVYRDAIHHYVPLSHLRSLAEMERIDGSIWTTKFRIPDNPESHDPVKYTYKNNLDALNYSVKVMREMIFITDCLVKFIPRVGVAGALANVKMEKR